MNATRTAAAIAKRDADAIADVDAVLAISLAKRGAIALDALDKRDIILGAIANRGAFLVAIADAVADADAALDVLADAIAKRGAFLAALDDAIADAIARAK